MSEAIISSANTIVLASGNVGKLAEIQNYFAQLPLKFVPQSQFAFTEAEENGLTFIENAILKARHACQQTHLPALADDSGIEVDALNGAPGVYSARYAGKKNDATANIQKLLTQMEDVPANKRTARFRCVLVFLRHAKDPSPLLCQGTWEGEILFQPRGSQGHGYDPIFYVPSHQCSAAELPLLVKNSISHRGQALQQLSSLLKQYYLQQ